MTTRRYLMCPPTYFGVEYVINPWMDLTVATSRELALSQWRSLRDTYLALGHTVDEIEPVRGLPDMVFAANGVVTAEAKAAFEKALASDGSDVQARYFLGLAAEQDGNRAQAAAIWRALVGSLRSMSTSLARPDSRSTPR